MTRTDLFISLFAMYRVHCVFAHAHETNCWIGYVGYVLNEKHISKHVKYSSSLSYKTMDTCWKFHGWWSYMLGWGKIQLHLPFLFKMGINNNIVVYKKKGELFTFSTCLFIAISFYLICMTISLTFIFIPQQHKILS